ncbi:Amyloid-Like Protein 1 [Manis pentadactyla]|nr:Amyloid-Like Protein 1 [Manis pentadactyla]
MAVVKSSSFRIRQTLGGSDQNRSLPEEIRPVAQQSAERGDTDIAPPGLRTLGPGESDLSDKIQYEEWTATRMHPRLKLQ